MTSKVNKNWKIYKVSNFVLTIGLQGNDKRKIALLLTVAGCSALDMYNTSVFTEKEKDKFDVVMVKFEQSCTPKKKMKCTRGMFSETRFRKSQNR